jgi:hypothetical protein
MTRKIDPEYESVLYENLVYSNDPEHLARYIERGGTITDELRDELAALIREKARKPRGSSDRLRDIKVYQDVERWRQLQIDDPVRKKVSDGDLSGEEAFFKFLSEPRGKLPSLQKAFEHFAKDDPDGKTDAIQKQYERGRDILNFKN